MAVATAFHSRIGVGESTEHTSTRRWMSLGVRIALLAMLVLALAGLTRKNKVDALGVVFVVDQSASVSSEGRKKAVDFINQSLVHQESGDVTGVVVFGAEALVDTSPVDGLKTHQISSKPSPHHTDIAAGLRLATAVMPPDRARKIVVLSDGVQTKGKAENQILLTAGSDLEIATVDLVQLGPDARLEELVVYPDWTRGSQRANSRSVVEQQVRSIIEMSGISVHGRSSWMGYHRRYSRFSLQTLDCITIALFWKSMMCRWMYCPKQRSDGDSAILEARVLWWR